MTEYKPLDSKIAMRAHHGTSFTPEKRGEQEIKRHKETFDQLSNELGDFFEQKHADKLHSLWTDYLHSHSNVMSTMITGPANFPIERNRKRSDWADNKQRAIFDYCNNLRKWKRKADNRQAVENAGGELAMKKAELEQAKAFHEKMKAANKIIRKALKNGGISDGTREELRSTGLAEKLVKKITDPDCFGGYGFARFSLTNSNARIKGMTRRVAELERREAAKESGVVPKVFDIEGGKVTYDFAENRINVKHEEKPSRDVIDKIKQHGFRWSRNYETWTRKMTDNAHYSAQSLIKTLAV